MSLLDKLKNNENMKTLLDKTKTLANEANEKFKEIKNKRDESNKLQENLKGALSELRDRMEKEIEKTLLKAYQLGYEVGKKEALSQCPVEYKIEPKQEQEADSIRTESKKD